MSDRRSEPATVAPLGFPERIGRYELLLPIGTGGMATVYLARLSGPAGFRREVALKLLHAHLREGLDPHLSLLEEAKVGSHIRHSNVVAVFDVGEDPFGVHLVMQYVEGDSVAGLCNEVVRARGRVPVPIALRILADSLAGLHAAHELCDDTGKPLHLVHRDFSPQNILVSVDGTSRLTDFGIAKITARSHFTEPGLVKGKIRYMSPEQARGVPLDRRSDVWSAGVVAWELFAGRRLHPGGDDVEALIRIVTQDAPRLRSAVPDIPEEIDEAVALALAREASDRLDSAEAFRARLLAAARGSTALADSAEVGSFVRSIAGKKLAARREKVGTILELRAKMGAVIETLVPDDGTGSSERSPPPAVTSAQRNDGDDEPSDAVVPLPRAPPPPKRRLGAAFVAAGALGAALLVGWSIQRSGQQAPASSRSPEPAEEQASNDQEAAPVESGGATERQGAPPAPAAEDAIAILADAPVARVRIGDRSFSLATPSMRVLVPLGPEDAPGISLEAEAVDGRVAAASLEPGRREIELAFGPKVDTKAAPSKRPRAASASPRPSANSQPKSAGAASNQGGKSAPPIAPSPYRRTTP